MTHLCQFWRAFPDSFGESGNGAVIWRYFTPLAFPWAVQKVPYGPPSVVLGTTVVCTQLGGTRGWLSGSRGAGWVGGGVCPARTHPPGPEFGFISTAPNPSRIWGQGPTGSPEVPQITPLARNSALYLPRPTLARFDARSHPGIAGARSGPGTLPGPPRAGGSEVQNPRPGPDLGCCRSAFWRTRGDTFLQCLAI